MPPIPIHRDAPIHPRISTDSRSDPESKTAAKPAQDYTPASHPQTASPNHPPPPTRTTPAHVPATTTSTLDAFSPPAPQPGAVPTPPSLAAPTGSSNSHDGSPPAPQPGAAPTPGGRGYTATHTTTETRLGAPLPQFSIPPPTTSYLATHSTSPHPQTSPYQTQHTGGAVLPPQEAGERSSLEHPPGYVQAPDRYSGQYAVPQQGGGSGSGSGSGAGTGEEGITDTAWNLLSKAGEALKKGEEAAWRAVRNKG